MGVPSRNVSLSTRATPRPQVAGHRLAVRVLSNLTDRQRSGPLLETEHFLGSRFPAGDRRYQVAGKDDQ
jgi:hypothetical protein